MKSHASFSRRRASGYTLMELLATMAILAILASIATPTYMAHVRKSRRTEARQPLLELAAREERLFSTTNAYSSKPADLGYGAENATFPIKVGAGYYNLTVEVSGPESPPAFTLTATPVAGMGQEKDFPCASFTVTHTGQQSAKASTGADTSVSCWK